MKTGCGRYKRHPSITATALHHREIAIIKKCLAVRAAADANGQHALQSLYFDQRIWGSHDVKRLEGICSLASYSSD